VGRGRRCGRILGGDPRGHGKNWGRENEGVHTLITEKEGGADR